MHRDRLFDDALLPARDHAASLLCQHCTPRRAPVTAPASNRLEWAADIAQISIAAETVRAALDGLERSHATLYRNVCDETGTVRRHLNVFVNSDNVRDLDGVDTTLTAGDVVTILPAVSGG